MCLSKCGNHVLNDFHLSKFAGMLPRTGEYIREDRRLSQQVLRALLENHVSEGRPAGLLDGSRSDETYVMLEAINFSHLQGCDVRVRRPLRCRFVRCTRWRLSPLLSGLPLVSRSMISTEVNKSCELHTSSILATPLSFSPRLLRQGFPQKDRKSTLSCSGSVRCV